MVDYASAFAALRQHVAPDITEALRQLIETGADARLNRVNPLRFASEHGFGEQDCIAAFLHSTRLGLFDLGWNVLCPGCAGTLHAGSSLRDIDRESYACTLCAREDQPTLDESIEVAFTVSPRIRKIAALGGVRHE